MKHKISWILVITLLVLLAACNMAGKGSQIPEGVQSPSPTPDPTPSATFDLKPHGCDVVCLLRTYVLPE